MGLKKFLKLVKCIIIIIIIIILLLFNAKETASHMTEAEYLKVNLPMLVLTCGR